MSGTVSGAAVASIASTESAHGVVSYSTKWTESSDGGLGQISHAQAHVRVQDGVATVSSRAGEGWQPSGAESGQAHGLYGVTMQIATAPGAFACLRPTSDIRPGPEIDFIELDGNGNAYSTIHWKGADGGDADQSYALTGIAPRAVRTYSLEWAEDHLSLFVDGNRQSTDTQHVPKDATHGGENAAFGVGEQPARSGALQQGDNSVDVLDMSYAKPTGSAATPAGVPVTVGTPTTGITDVDVFATMAPTPEPSVAPGPEDSWTNLTPTPTVWTDLLEQWLSHVPPADPASSDSPEADHPALHDEAAGILRALATGDAVF